MLHACVGNDHGLALFTGWRCSVQPGKHKKGITKLRQADWCHVSARSVVEVIKTPQKKRCQTPAACFWPFSTLRGGGSPFQAGDFIAFLGWGVMGGTAQDIQPDFWGGNRVGQVGRGVKTKGGGGGAGQPFCC